MRLALLLAASAGLFAQADWPRFRGPNGAGVAEGTPPVDFGPARNLAWRVSPPAGKSSPIVAGGKLILTGHDGDRFLTVAYDAASGIELWRREVKRRNIQKRHKLNDPAAPTAAADRNRVVVFFTEFGLASYTLDGKVEWTLPLDEMSSMQGVSASPVLHDGSVYLVVDQARNSYVLSVNAANGETRWRTPRPDAVGGIYSSPVIFTGGPEPVLGVLGDIEFSAYALTSGERVWWVSGLPSQAKTSPAVAGDRIVMSVNAMAEESQIPVFAALLAGDANNNRRLDRNEAKGVPLAVFPAVDRNRDNQIDETEWNDFRVQALQPSATVSIRPRGLGDITKTAVEWRVLRAVPNVPSPLIAGGLVYTVRNGGVAGISDAATGEVKKEFRLPGALGDYYASPVAAGKHVYFASMEGKITVMEAGAEGRITATIPMEEEIFATPAIVGNALYVRTQQGLYCFQTPKPLAVDVRRGPNDKTSKAKLGRNPAPDAIPSGFGAPSSEQRASGSTG
ncbi:MAG: PQQ-binding-like beta-propeller repeat protein [Acidobacteria bacterium]|nr:PQQ-binding-like beta-propeller repeat protein [Acidobacteriota bacterium]